MKCYEEGRELVGVEEIDPVYRSVQFDAEYMRVIDDNCVCLYYPCRATRKDWLYIINGKPYTSIFTNLFNDKFDNMIRSPRILLSYLNCYRDGWKIVNNKITGDECERIISKESLNDQTKTKLRMCLEFLLKSESIRTVNALRESQEMQARIIELEREIIKLKEKNLVFKDYE